MERRIKTAVLPKPIHRVNVIPAQIPACFFSQTDHRKPPFIWKWQGAKIGRMILRMKVKEDSYFLIPNLTAKLTGETSYSNKVGEVGTAPLMDA